MNNCFKLKKNISNSEIGKFIKSFNERYKYDIIFFILSIEKNEKNSEILNQLKRDSDILLTENPKTFLENDVFIFSLFNTNTEKAYIFLNRLEMKLNIIHYYISDKREDLDSTIQKFCSSHPL